MECRQCCFWMRRLVMVCSQENPEQGILCTWSLPVYTSYSCGASFRESVGPSGTYVHTTVEPLNKGHFGDNVSS